MRGTGKRRDNKPKKLPDGQVVYPGNLVDDAYEGIVAGIKACGDDVVINTSTKRDPVMPNHKYAVQFGYGRRLDSDKKHAIQNFRHNVINHQKSKGGYTFCFDGAFFKSLGIYNYWRFGLNSPLANGVFLNENSPSDRWKKFKKQFNVPYREWSMDGKYILICGQPDRGYSMNLQSTVELLREWVPLIKSQTNLPIVIKPHPNGMNNAVAAAEINEFIRVTDGVEILDPHDDIIPVLEDAARMITWNSTVAVDSVTMGIPTCSFHDMGFAYPVTDHVIDINNPTLFDRSQWLADINYAMWKPEELATGELWDKYKKYCADLEQRTP